MNVITFLKVVPLKKIIQQKLLIILLLVGMLVLLPHTIRHVEDTSHTSTHSVHKFSTKSLKDEEIRHFRVQYSSERISENQSPNILNTEKANKSKPADQKTARPSRQNFEVIDSNGKQDRFASVKQHGTKDDMNRARVEREKDHYNGVISNEEEEEDRLNLYSDVESEEVKATNLDIKRRIKKQRMIVKHKSTNHFNIRLSEEVVRTLGGMNLREQLVLHQSRAQWNNSVELLPYRQALTEAGKGYDPSVTAESFNPNILERGKFQQRQVLQFCAQQNVTSSLPSSTLHLNNLFQHLLYDDSKRLVYCYVPKNGCSNMKHLMLVLNGLAPPPSPEVEIPLENELRKVHSFRDLTAQEAVYRLQHYYKVVVVRNPLVRLLSAFRNKLEPPLDTTNTKHFPDHLKAAVLNLFRPAALHRGMADKSVKLQVLFEEFVEYMTVFPLHDYNEHFQPVMDLCAPCAIPYDFHLNFDSLNYDVYAVMDLLDIPKHYYRNSSRHSKYTTRSLLHKYFSDLSQQQNNMLYKIICQEMEFYYSLYPHERGMHLNL